MNGVVESLIKSVRRALESSCKITAYTGEQWRTFLAEVTFLVNSRPLYPGSDNISNDPPQLPQMTSSWDQISNKVAREERENWSWISCIRNR